MFFVNFGGCIKCVLTTVLLTQSLSAGSSSMLASTVGSSSAQAPRPRDYQMLALELQKATKEDLNERVHQLRLTRDLLVKQKDSDAVSTPLHRA